jgi:hypothetical protein
MYEGETVPFFAVDKVSEALCLDVSLERSRLRLPSLVTTEGPSCAEGGECERQLRWSGANKNVP